MPNQLSFSVSVLSPFCQRTNCTWVWLFMYIYHKWRLRDCYSCVLVQVISNDGCQELLPLVPCPLLMTWMRGSHHHPQTMVSSVCVFCLLSSSLCSLCVPVLVCDCSKAAHKPYWVYVRSVSVSACSFVWEGCWGSEGEIVKDHAVAHLAIHSAFVWVWLREGFHVLLMFFCTYAQMGVMLVLAHVHSLDFLYALWPVPVSVYVYSLVAILSNRISYLC